MGGFTFSFSSGVADSIFGKSQDPIKMLIETRGEAYQQQDMIPRLFMNVTSTNYGEKFTAMTSMNGFQAVGEGGAVPMDSMQESFSKTIEHETFKDGFTITREAMEDGKLIDMKQKPQAFVDGYYRARQQYAAAFYGAAMSGLSEVQFGTRKYSALCADKKPLFDKEHPSVYETKLKQTNKFSDEFSVDALGLMETAMQQFCGDNGEVLDVAPDTILIPNDGALKKAVFSAIGANKEPDTANNGFNYQFGRWNIITWPYLNRYLAKGKKPWMLIDSRFNQTYGGAIFSDRTALDITSDVDTNTHNNIWTGFARFGAGFNDWRFAAIGGVEGGTALGG